MLDLFDDAILPGFAFADDFLSADEEGALIDRIDAIDLSPFRFQQWTGKRLTHSFGWNYDFQAGSLGRGEPLPDWLLPLRERAAGFAGLAAEDLVQTLLLRYDIGAGIGWHRDRPVYQHVLGLSLGSDAGMRFRKRQGAGWQRKTVPLNRRGIYHLAGEVRHDWEHSISPLGELRHSITFRSLSEAGRRLAARSR